MSFIHSSFFSYRRNPDDINFIYNLKNIIQSEGKYATNHDSVFFDEKCIELGDDFDEKIYEGIKKSCSFTLIFSPIYINKDNDWCARELFTAIKFEKYIREKINNNKFCLIFPLIHRGKTEDLPQSIAKKNVKFLYEFTADIKNSSISGTPTTQNFEKFKAYLGEVYSENFKLIKDFEFDWDDIEKNVLSPKRDELLEWINEQNKLYRKNESENPPKLK